MGLIIALFLLGIILLLAELLIIPGIGIAGFLGLASLGGCCFYGFARYGTVGGIIVTIICCALVVGMLVYALRARTWKKLSLEEAIPAPPSPASEITPGMKGETLTRLAPSGTARIGGISVEVRCPDHVVDPGTEIEVTEVQDNKITVTPIWK